MKSFFLVVPKWDSRVLEAKMIVSFIKCGLRDFTFWFLCELGKFCKISYPQEVWNIESFFFSTRGYAEIHIQRPFLDNQEDIQKNVVLKI
jgi:hypothetical protein